MTFKEALSFIQQTIERTVTAAVKAVKSHTFRVDIGAKRFEVTNLPRIQQVEGEVKVSNQVDLSGEMKRVETQLKELKQTLGTLKPRDEVRVSNFPKQKPFPEPPKRMEIEGAVKYPPTASNHFLSP
jgi:NADPH-dependent ferric siderophore reductase